MQKRFETLITRARVVLFLERLWPVFVALACLVGLFLTLSFAGLWLVLPPFARLTGLAAFGLVAVWIVIWAMRLRMPTRMDALRRLDDSHTSQKGVASSLDDQLLNREPISTGIFEEHKRRLASLISGLRVRFPVLDLARLDPFAIRAAIVLSLVATAFLAGNERELRINAAFDANIALEAAAPARLDAWLTPPAYTGQVTLVLLGEKITPPSMPIAAPAGSILRFSSPEIGKLKLEDAPGLEALPGSDSERNFKVVADVVLNVPYQGGTRKMVFQLIPDAPPSISLLLPMERGKRGELTFKFRTQDDYGVRAAATDVAAPDAGVRVLSPAPQLPLALPPKGGIGEGRGTLEFDDSPWAGAKVKLSLSATDDAGQTGHSAVLDLVLPQKVYRNELARALIEQRRDLLLFPDVRRMHVHEALEALQIAPDIFGTPASAYLGVRTAYSRLKAARSDVDLLEVGALLLDVAQGVESGGRSGADKALQAAKDALREAIKNGASKEEIARLMQELRAALDKALKEAAKNPNAPMKNAKKLSSEDLKDLLNKLEDSAKAGDDEQAQALLNMLDDLTAVAEGEGKGEDGASPLDEALNGLDDLAREQQDLRDKTFSQNHEDTGQAEGDKGAELKQNQADLRQKLDALKRKLAENGVQGEGLAAADEAMKQAEGALGKGKQGRGAAVDAQGKALEALRKETQALAEQGEQNSKSGKGSRSSKRDPLGRDSSEEDADGFKDGGAGTAKATSAARARRVYKEIQKRLGDVGRPLQEKDYLDRLLKNY